MKSFLSFEDLRAVELFELWEENIAQKSFLFFLMSVM